MHDDFGDFVTATSPGLSRSAFLLTGDHHLAEDLLQSAYANAFRHWRRIRQGNPEAYVRKSLLHQHISWWRRRKTRDVPVALEPEVAVRQRTGGARSTSGSFDSAAANSTGTRFDDTVADRITVTEALRQLSPRQQAVVVLRYYEDLTETQTAQALGCSVGTVKRYNHEALARLRDALHTEAAQAPVYDILEQSLGTAKKRRLRKAVTTLAAIAAIIILIATGYAGIHHQSMPPADPGPPSIPDKVFAPSALRAQAENDPPGPASVLLGGSGWGHVVNTDDDDVYAVVGANSDVYRKIYAGTDASRRDAQLSPDGSQIAVISGLGKGRFGLLDLRTGHTRIFVPYQDNDHYLWLLAWSHDGSKIGVQVHGGTFGYGIIDAETGELRMLPKLVAANDIAPNDREPDLAFSPDGTRFALMTGGDAVIMDMDFRTVQRFKIDGKLAGKGAWTPDGTGLLALNPDNKLVKYDVATGKPDGPIWTVDNGYSIIRIEGWSPAGEPVVEAKSPLPPPGYFGEPLIAIFAIGGNGSRTLLTAPKKSPTSI